ncbi:hypothetical protein QE152_g9021 [Popillia japonica]|uniref:Uncharacterized protein n=1 Tax=Popillia japonica TaxID=7064 RepID=A0AAW1LW66_POPJA
MGSGLWAEAHVAIMKAAIVIISDEALYDGIFYINHCEIKELPADEIDMSGDKLDFLLKTGAHNLSGFIAPSTSPASQSP